MRQRSVWSLFTQNFGLKLIAFFSSLVIWLWVQTKQTDQEKIRSQVQYILPKDFVILNQPSQIVTVMLEGPKGVMRQFKDMEVQTNVNLSVRKEGSFDPEFMPNDIVNLPSGVKVIQFSPPTVNVIIDKQITRTLKITPTLSGSPQRGWKLIEASVQPDMVTVTGAQQILSNVASINTLGISLSDRSSSSTQKVNLEKKHTSFVFQELEHVQVHLVFEEEVLETTFTKIPIIVPPGWIATPSQTDIVVKGPLLEIEQLEPEALRLNWLPPEDWDQTSPLNPSFSLYQHDTLLSYSFQVRAKNTFMTEPKK